MSPNATSGAPTLEDRAEGLLHVLIGFAGVALCLYGVGLFCFQGYVWLRFGTWVALPAAVFLMDAPPQDKTVSDSPERDESALDIRRSALADLRPYIPYLQVPRLAEWLRRPTSWFGLHKLATYALNLISVPALVIVVGWWIASAAFDAADDRSTRASTRPNALTRQTDRDRADGDLSNGR